MDTNYALDLLPAEVWRLILLKIKSSKDFKNLSNCSVFFKELLMGLRTNFLVSEVFGIVFLRTTGKLLETQKHESKVAALDIYFMKTDTNLKQTILNCRMVCSSWKKAVESCYKQQIMTGNTTFVEDINRKSAFFKPVSWNMERFCFYFQPEKATQFVHTFVNSSYIVSNRNPFIGRLVHIEITLDPVEEEVEFVLAIEKILRNFGREIWYAYLFITTKRGSIGVNDYLRVKEYIGWLPNLRYLYLRLNTYNASGLNNRLVNQHPLPKLEHLVVLELGDMIGPVLNEFVAKNRHVLYFGMHGQNNFPGSVIEKFPNLKGFSATCVGQSDNMILNWIGGHYDLEILQLQQRCIDFNMNLCFQYLKNHLANSLKDLTLELFFPVDQLQLVQGSKNLRLHLPHLQRLAIQFSGIHFLDFICTLNNLQVFEVMVVTKEYVANYDFYRNMVESEQVVRFVGYETRMFDSNIWRILEKLRKVKINFEDTCRCYEYNKKF